MEIKTFISFNGNHLESERLLVFQAGETPAEPIDDKTEKEDPSADTPDTKKTSVKNPDSTPEVSEAEKKATAKAEAVEDTAKAGLAKADEEIKTTATDAGVDADVGNAGADAIESSAKLGPNGKEGRAPSPDAANAEGADAETPEGEEEEAEKPLTDQEFKEFNELRKDSTLKMIQDLTDDPEAKKTLEKHFLAMSGYTVDGDPSKKENIHRADGFAPILGGVMFAIMTAKLVRGSVDKALNPEEVKNLDEILKSKFDEIEKSNLLQDPSIDIKEGKVKCNLKFKTDEQGTAAMQEFHKRLKEMPAMDGITKTDSGVDLENASPKDALAVMELLEAIHSEFPSKKEESETSEEESSAEKPKADKSAESTEETEPEASEATEAEESAKIKRNLQKSEAVKEQVINSATENLQKIVSSKANNILDVDLSKAIYVTESGKDKYYVEIDINALSKGGMYPSDIAKISQPLSDEMNRNDLENAIQKIQDEITAEDLKFRGAH